MTLKKYRQKRTFRDTAEPYGSKPTEHKSITKAKAHNAFPKQSEALQFVIQKHAASHLHYDFRLEMNGVLKSWAVPKGPSLDPHIKRLAVLVEDHPLEYADFEGVIPKSHYGGGNVIIWDKGFWYTPTNPKAQLKKGDITILLEGKKLKGLWKLIRFKTDNKNKDKDKNIDNGKENWLLFKVNDKYAKEDYDILTKKPKSIVSKRTIDEISKKQKQKQKQK